MDEEEGKRASKKLKQHGAEKKKQTHRTLFAPFRALGIITNHVPFVVQSRSSKDLKRAAITAVTCTGNSWAMWDIASNMRLLFVGPDSKDAITSLAIENDSIYATAGSCLHQYIRGKLVHTLDLAHNDEQEALAPPSSSSSKKLLLDRLTIFGGYACCLDSTGRHAFVISLQGSQSTAGASASTAVAITPKSAPALHTTLDFGPNFTATHILHPSTYLNKIVVASKQGGLQLWNVATRNLIHEFAPSSLTTSSEPASITCMVQSPAIDVIAVGFANGRITLFDIRMGEILLSFSQTTATLAAAGPNANVITPVSESKSSSRTREMLSERAVTALSFRTDNEAQTLASSDGAGNIALWDLDAGGRLSSLVRRAHERIITGLVFLPGQPVLVSSGADNAMRQWIFDTPTSPPRLLKYRSGHHSPPSLIRFYGSDGKTLLTSAPGDRSLRYTSLVRDSRSHELSQGNVQSHLNKLQQDNPYVQITELKFPPIQRIAFPELGQGNGGFGGTGNGTIARREWEDVVSVHVDEEMARTWSVENKRLGKHILSSLTGDGRKQASTGGKNKQRQRLESTGKATACCVTACGNFGLVGYEDSDRVAMWNLQSGIRRREFKLPLTTSKLASQSSSTSSRWLLKHVTGLETDSLNSLLVCATKAGQLHFYDFHSGAIKGSLDLPAGIQSTLLQRDNNLLACVCEDRAVRIVDIETRRVVREFAGFKDSLVDVAFSHDSHWLVCASRDSLVRTFDIPTGQLVDVFRTRTVATSIAFSPTGEFLATSHADEIGVYLWANRAQFANVTLRSIDENAVLASMQAGTDAAGHLPAMRAEATADGEGEGVATEDDNLASLLPINADEDQETLGGSVPYPFPRGGPGVDEQISTSSLATMSLLPRSKWQTLIHLESIQKRNKPTEPPKKPESAPFFLPTLAGTEVRFDVSTSSSSQVQGSGDVEMGESDAVSRREQSRKLAFGGLNVESPLVQALRAEVESGSQTLDTFFKTLLGLSASALDLEIRSLTSKPQLVIFARALTARLRARRDFEAIQAILKVFLAVHSETLTGQDQDENEMTDDEPEDGGKDDANDELRVALQELLEAQVAETKAVGSLVRSSLGMIAWTRGVPVV